MRFPALIALFFLGTTCSFAQAGVSALDPPLPNLAGHVAYPAEPAFSPPSHVWIHEYTGKQEFATTTDKQGNFSIHLPDGYYDVMIGSPGFAPFSICVWIHSGEPTRLKIELEPDYKNLQY